MRNLKAISKIVFVFLLSLPFQLRGQCLPLDSTLAVHNAFQAGEHLFYTIHYRCLGIRTDVGHADVELFEAGTHKGRPVYHTVAAGRTKRFWDAFFRVRDLFESRFYAEGIRPVHFHRDIHEGKYTIQNFYDWLDSDSIDATVIRKNSIIDTVLPGHRCTFDVLTLFYYARNVDFDALEQGVNQPVSFAIDDDIYNIYFRFIGREEKRIPRLGTFRTMKFAAKVVAGKVFTGEQEMLIWVSDDRNRVPLLFQSPIIVGSVFGRLTDWTNLKYPFECKIK